MRKLHMRTARRAVHTEMEEWKITTSIMVRCPVGAEQCNEFGSQRLFFFHDPSSWNMSQAQKSW